MCQRTVPKGNVERLNEVTQPRFPLVTWLGGFPSSPPCLMKVISIILNIGKYYIAAFTKGKLQNVRGDMNSFALEKMHLS